MRLTLKLKVGQTLFLSFLVLGSLSVLANLLLFLEIDLKNPLLCPLLFSQNILSMIYEPLRFIVYQNYTIFSVAILLSPFWVFFIGRIWGRKTRFLQSHDLWIRSVAHSKVYLIVTILLTMAIVGYPSLKFLVGGDTIFYIYYTDSYYHNPASALISYDRPLFIWITILVQYLTQVPTVLLYRILPSFFVIPYIFGIFYLTKELERERNELVVIYSILLGGISTYFLRTSIELFPQMLALGFFYIFWGAYLRFLRTRKNLYFVMLFAILMCVLMIHWYTFIAFSIVVALLVFRIAVEKGREGFQIISLTLKMYLPSMIFILSLMVYFLLHPQTFGLGRQMIEFGSFSKSTIVLGSQVLGEFLRERALRWSLGDISLMGNVIHGNVLPSLLTPLSFAIIKTKVQNNYYQKSILWLWFSSFSVLILVYPPVFERLALLLPIPILGGYALASFEPLFCTFSESIKKRKNFFRFLARIIILYVVVVSLNEAVFYQNLRARPVRVINPDTEMEIEWVRDNFRNEKFVFVVRDYDAYVWSLALSKGAFGNRYYGNILYLLVNKSDEEMLRSPFFNEYFDSIESLEMNNVLANITDYTVVLTESTYQPDNIEMGFLEKGTLLMDGSAFWMDDSFQQGWFLYNSDKNVLSCGFMTDGNIANQYVEGTSSPTWAEYAQEINVSTTTGRYLTVKVKGTPNSDFGIFLYSNGWIKIAGNRCLDEFEKYVFDLNDIVHENTTFQKIVLSVTSTDGKKAIVNWDYVVFSQNPILIGKIYTVRKISKEETIQLFQSWQNTKGENTNLSDYKDIPDYLTFQPPKFLTLVVIPMGFGIYFLLLALMSLKRNYRDSHLDST